MQQRDVFQRLWAVERSHPIVMDNLPLLFRQAGPTTGGHSLDDERRRSALVANALLTWRLMCIDVSSVTSKWSESPFFMIVIIVI